MSNTPKPVKAEKIIRDEDDYLRFRRQKLGAETADSLEATRFGIALSGGGIRSATINLGFLKALNQFGLLKRADYLSTVSGGGYTGAYVQGTLKNEPDYKKLFSQEHLEYMRSRGEYLFPGQGLTKMWNQFVLVISYLVSLVMSFIGPGIFVLLAMGVYLFLDDVLFVNGGRFREQMEGMLYYGSRIFLVVLVVHYLFNLLLVFNLEVSAYFDRVQTALVGVALITVVGLFFSDIEGLKAPVVEEVLPYLGIGMLLIVMGMFTSPNATSFHRFYRRQLSAAFLHFSGSYRNVPLSHLAKAGDADARNYTAPYPLINTCLNLLSSNDPNFQGTKASDYFLLSPLYAGSKLTGYVPTGETVGYSALTLPSAVTISAAAVNPGMGIYSSKILSVLTTLLNLRLGYWIWNPLRLGSSYPVVWWPFYFFYELLGRIGTDKKMVNISDGGHIENLAVFELLRRRCRLIVCVDAGEDPNFIFEDIENLTIRARNELGLAIRFREGQNPEDIIRPLPSHGYSRHRFAVADVFQLWDKVMVDGQEVIEHYKNKKVGTLVYVKSAVTAPQGRPDIAPDDYLKYGTYKYKLYHPLFPHEPTSDQFFDPIQWESYFQLGQYIGAEVLGITNMADFEHDPTCPEIPLNLLLDYFDEGVQLFGSMPIPLPTPVVANTRGGALISEEEKVPVDSYSIVPPAPIDPGEEIKVDKAVDYNM